MTDPIYKTIDDLPSPPSLSVGDKIEVSHAGTSYGATVAQLATQVSGSFLPLTGGTLSGPLSITGPAGTARPLFFYTGADKRWDWQVTGGAEAGSNAGSDLVANGFSDAGAFLGQWLNIKRSNGLVTLTGPLTGTTATFSGNGSFGGTLSVSSHVTAGTAAVFGWNLSTLFSAPTDGTYRITTFATTAGVTLDAATDATLKVRNRANSADAAIAAGAGTFSGALAGTSASFSGNVTSSGNVSAKSTLFAVGSGGVNNGIVQHDDTHLYVRPTNAGSNMYLGAGNANHTLVTSTGHFWPNTTGVSNLGDSTARWNNIYASGTVFAPGAQIQMVSTQTGAVATGTTLVPLDDTIPQITEGDQYMSLAITPKSATSKLIIEVVAGFAYSTTGGHAAALFQDAGANALAAFTNTIITANTFCTYNFKHVMTSGTTSSTTFRFRMGGQSAGTTTFNGLGGTRFMGGVMASSIVITETAP